MFKKKSEDFIEKILKFQNDEFSITYPLNFSFV